MLSPLMMKMPVATATPTSGYSRCHDGTTFEAACGHAKERRDDLVRRANANALLPPLAHFACPSCPPSRDIVGAALCCRSGLWVRAWGETQGQSPGEPGPPLFCYLRWPAGIWGHFFFLNLVAGGQLDLGGHLVVHTDRLRQRYFAGLRRWAKTNASCPSPHHSLHSSAHLK